MLNEMTHAREIRGGVSRRTICTFGSRLRSLVVHAANMDNSDEIVLDQFAFRQFDDPKYSGTKLTSISKKTFMRRVLDFYEERKAIELEFRDRPALIDGYAPFCKHLFMPNFVSGLQTSCLEINKSNEHLLRTRYESRTDSELPVLIRYFPSELVDTPECKFLDLILYSREQILKENEATGGTFVELEPAPWRLISIKAQDVPYETPMNPITMMRNAIIAEGGSGVPIDRQAYMASVEYWSRHAAIT